MPRKTAVRQSRDLDAGPLQDDIDLFELFLIGDNKAPKTRRIYIEATQWFAAEQLLPDVTDWTGVTKKHLQLWRARLLTRYSDSYASNQYRALQAFFKWYAAENRVDNPTWGLKPPKIRPKLVPVLSDDDLGKLARAAKGVGFEARRNTAIIKLFRDTGIRLSELAGLELGDLDIKQCEAQVTGKGGKQRIVHFTTETALALGQYLKERSRHKRARRPELWLAINRKEGMTANGVYKVIKKLGDKAGVEIHPHQFRHTFSHNWLDSGGEEGDLMELNGWESTQMLKIYGRSARSQRARRNYDRIMGKGA
jgi:site-specific recombinase XerD